MIIILNNFFLFPLLHSDSINTLFCETIKDIGLKDEKKYILSLMLVCLGIVLGFPLFSISYYTMVRTSTPQFCASCHEIRFAYDTWKTSTHANNAQGFVADCMDCHLPAPHDTFNFFYAKTAHGIKDVVAHFIGGAYDRQKNRQAASASLKNEQCMKCHRNILYIPDKRGAMLAHRAVLFARAGYEKKCMDCHRGLVHNPAPVYRYKQYEIAYRGLGK
ncbi:MAG: cytochrome C [Desulfobacteraceae bacterium]|nr:cytochrome C [Desulfobacteraceae bacterium]